MPKKLPSSSEAPWITLLAYHQRNLDLATICWKYWGVTEALASLRQHSLHIWSAGQPARILSWLLPSWAGHWQQHQCRQPSTAQHIQTIPWEQSFSNWFTGRSTLQLRNPFEDLTPPPRKFCFQKDSWGSQGRALSTLGHPSMMCSVFQGMFGSVWKIGEYSQEAMDYWLSMTTPAMNSLQLLLCCLFWSCFTNASHTHIQVTNLHIRTWEGDGTSLWLWCWLRSLLWWWPTYSQLPFLWNLSAEWRLNPALCFPETPWNDLPLTIYIRHLCPEGI